MSAPRDAPLLLVGFQRGVRPALRALGRPAVALVASGREPTDAPELAGCAAVDLHGPREPLEAAARELLGGARPAAVVALAERTVLVAARLRAAFGLPGNGPEVALACADKLEMKRALGACGVPVARWREVTATTEASELVEALGLPLVLKPRRDSGGRGQRRLEAEADVAAALTELFATPEEGYGWLAEGWVDGVEMSVESFVHAGAPCFQNPTEYYVPRHANIAPAVLPADEWAELRAFVARALAAVGVDRGVTHLELFRTARGPVVGELAIRPPGGRLMTLLRRAWGLDPWEAMLRLELGEAPAFPAAPVRTAGVWVLHPGAGRVATLEGVEAARAVPHVRRVNLKVRVGDGIGERAGTGQDVGSIHAEAPDRDAVAAALTRARAALHFGLE